MRYSLYYNTADECDFVICMNQKPNDVREDPYIEISDKILIGAGLSWVTSGISPHSSEVPLI